MATPDSNLPKEKSPNELLADLVVSELKAAGLATDRKVAEITAKLASGNARQDDWQGWIELSIDEQAKGTGHAQA